MDVGGARPATPWADFGRELRHWRRRAGLTQAQVGARIGYHHSLISKLESGWREPPAAVVRRLDDLLQTGGQLAAIWTAGISPRGPRVPLPGTVSVGRGADVAPLDRPWPSRLPVYGLTCPLHDGERCWMPGPEAALEAYRNVRRAQVGGPVPSGADLDVVHGLTALLAAHAMAATESTTTRIAAAVEGVLHVIARWAQVAADSPAHAPFRLAAHYAQLAGRLRLHRGQNGLAMAWFGNGLQWAMMSGDLAARVTLLSDMSTLARLERDAPSASAYARAMGEVDPARAWVATLSSLYQARAFALDGDLAQCQHHIGVARAHLERLGDPDRDEAPWLFGPAGQLRVESGVGGALRDIAVLTGSRSAARLAIEATEFSLVHLPAQMRATHLLLTLRLADNYACAAEPAAALAVAEPVLAEAAAAERTTITRELDGLRSRLLARWGDVRDVREFELRAVGERG